MQNLEAQIAEELGANTAQVQAAIGLLDEGATVPFIARYRKEATGGLDDTQLRLLQERLGYLRELESRRVTVLKSIGEQGKLTPELERAVRQAATKVALEDLYRPYMPKRRTKAQIAREAGLEPLCQSLLDNPQLEPAQAAAAYVDAEKGVGDIAGALEGARFILIEQLSEHPQTIAQLREYGWQEGRLAARVVEGKEQEGNKFADYFTYEEGFKSIPSHRALALLRGLKTGVLNLQLVFEDDANAVQNGEKIIAAHAGIAQRGRPADAWLWEGLRLAWRTKIRLYMESELKRRLREQAETEAIQVFARNLHDLLLAAPAGERVTMGLDPGLRTGVKVAVVDKTGKLVDTATIYPHAPKNQWQQSLALLALLAQKHAVELIAIGNGTASRETDKLAGDLIKQHPELKLTKITVSEAGASVYSASALAAKEFPELDVSLRGAVSIARRLQDPLAELVKIEPKSIGVGQYQHDVNQSQLGQGLDNVVEDCVNAVGVDVNTASVPLLQKVAGLNGSLAQNIVAYRDEHGPFPNRKTVLKVPRLGPKAFEQAAGFLRIRNGDNPLDASAVHPEAYPLVERILRETQKTIKEVIGNIALLRSLQPAAFTGQHFGEPTVRDILAELEKPGRDPRPVFQTAQFKDGVNTLEDLQPGMPLQGVITNVTNFGAFVDIGVHQDGLVHISAMADQYVKDPHSIVKTGDVVHVKVLEVDAPRKRISLTMRLNEKIVPEKPVKEPVKHHTPQQESAKDFKRKQAAAQNRGQAPTAMAEAFAKLKIEKPK